MSRSAVRVRSSAHYLVAIFRENSALPSGFGPRPGLTYRNPLKMCFWSNGGMAAQLIDFAHWLYYLDTCSYCLLSAAIGKAKGY